MKTLVVFDSLYGNTEKIAKDIFSVLKEEKEIKSLNKIKAEDLLDFDLLIFGSPTHGGRAKEEVNKFLDDLPSDYLKGKKVATFDTRVLPSEQKLPLHMLMKLIGYAAPKLEKKLKSKGAKIIFPSIGFLVSGKKGPLKEGELEKALLWAKQLLNAK